MANRETEIQKQIVQLCTRPHIYLVRVNSGAVKSEFGGWLRLAPKGTPDILGYKHEYIRTKDEYGAWNELSVGRFVCLEVKRPGKKPTKEQQEFLDRARRLGCIAACVHSVEEAMHVLGLAKPT